MNMGNLLRTAGWGAAAVLLLLPLVAMQFTTEVQWTLSDFIVAGILIGSVGVALELAARASRDWAYRAGALIAVAAAFLMTWINLAVGIIGSEDNPRNLLYFAVVAIGLAGAAIARFKPAGMSRAMAVTATAQALVPLIALATAERMPPLIGVAQVFVLSSVFAVMFAGSALLFRTAARKRDSSAA